MTKKDEPKTPKDTGTPTKPEIPLPVPSIGTTPKKQPPKAIPGTVPGDKPVSDDKIHTDDSDQTTPVSPHKADQIDAGGTTSADDLKPPASPPKDDKKDKKDIPALPFNKDDVMAKKPPEKPAIQPPAVIPNGGSPAVRTDSELSQQMSDKKTANWLQAQGGEYKVHGNSRPDAASIQGAANKNKVSTEILSAVQTKEYAEVIVRTHLRGQYVDTVVHHDFENSRQILLLEMASKNPDAVESFTSGGMPVFKQGATFKDQQGKTKNLMVTVMHTLLADIQFSIRDATTKATAAGQAKILNQDWQGEEEQELELHERELVESLRSDK